MAPPVSAPAPLAPPFEDHSHTSGTLDHQPRGPLRLQPPLSVAKQRRGTVASATATSASQAGDLPSGEDDDAVPEIPAETGAQRGGAVTSATATSASRADIPTSPDDDAVPEILAEAVARHNRPDDCWLIIDQKVYDVTSWIPKHPGGPMIYVHPGQDCTQLFESYHPLYVRKMLDKFLVGRLAARTSLSSCNGEDQAPAAARPLRFSPDTGFYTTVKGRVEAHFKKHKVNPRVHPEMYWKTACVFLGYALCFYGAYLAPWGLPYAAVCAFLFGVVAGQGPVSVQHDSNHGAYSASPTLSYLMGLSMDLIGMSSFYWKQQHVVGHHVNTNVVGFDPDVRVFEPDLRRVAPHQRWRWCHSYQHIYWMFLYGLIGIKSVLIDDFCTYATGTVGPMKMGKMSMHEELVFWTSKVLYFSYMFLLPAAVGNRTPLQFFILYLISTFSAGFLLAFMFQVNHVVPGSEFPSVYSDPASGDPAVGLPWAVMQVMTSANFSPGSSFWNHFTGGLNHQIEHHLFPGICHVYYLEIQPIVEATCKEFGVPYNCYPSFWAALKGHFGYLKEVGAAPTHLHAAH